ncbi:MAG: hypothetical protein KAR20_03880, partial [Candidatus Heimdallarchaeota archaeon]|nr:hypothetical protein [Candidatus Heimdallarchaeota archaeon]
MGILRLHIGPRGSYYYFKDKIIGHLSSGKKETFLYFLPVNRALRYFKKDLVLTTDCKAVIDPPVYTFRSFFQHLYKYFPQKKRIISQPMRLLLIDHILRENQAQLRYFNAQQMLGNGLVMKADQMVEEFCQFGYRTDDFIEPPPAAESKFTDFGFLITELYRIYGDQLIDESSLIGELTHELDADLLKNIYPDLEKI